jgi:CRISPR/Cas system-associated exonuclease Cas4 (RecB family)
VHRILELIKTEGDWMRLKKSLFTSMTLGQKDKKTILSRVEKVLDYDETKIYFEDGLHVETEQAFVSSDGQIYKPDRIVKSENLWTVIDYKSSVEGMEKHKNQVQQYCDLLSEIEGPNIEGIIIYTDPLKVLKVV